MRVLHPSSPRTSSFLLNQEEDDELEQGMVKLDQGLEHLQELARELATAIENQEGEEADDLLEEAPVLDEEYHTDITDNFLDLGFSVYSPTAADDGRREEVYLFSTDVNWVPAHFSRKCRRSKRRSFV